MDACSQLALLAVEKLNLDFAALSRDRIAICLSVEAGSLSTDVEYWKGRDAAGGPSPTLFAYTLPSSALGEIAIRYQITGPNLCFFGENGGSLEAEARYLVSSGEAEACLFVSCQIITAEVARILGRAPKGEARALFLVRESSARSKK
jgi:3-oxoacyl-(acyl-carrier-protein) synthase